MNFELILLFLQKLARNNNRAWFEKNKPMYLEAKANFDEFLGALLKELIRIDESLGGLNPKKLAFRIYRDVRFSKDKSPYKVNMGAGFSPGGKMEQEPGYYIHIQPGNKSFLAAGLYMPDSPNVAKIRQEIDYNPDRIVKILNNATFRRHFDKLDDFDRLKTAPKGYPKDHPHLELLKYRSIVATHYFTDKDVKDKKFIKKVMESAKVIRPLNEFLKEAIA